MVENEKNSNQEFSNRISDISYKYTEKYKHITKDCDIHQNKWKWYWVMSMRVLGVKEKYPKAKNVLL